MSSGRPHRQSTAGVGSCSRPRLKRSTPASQESCCHTTKRAFTTFDRFILLFGTYPASKWPNRQENGLPQFKDGRRRRSVPSLYIGARSGASLGTVTS